MTVPEFSNFLGGSLVRLFNSSWEIMDFTSCGRYQCSSRVVFIGVLVKILLESGVGDPFCVSDNICPDLHSVFDSRNVQLC